MKIHTRFNKVTILQYLLVILSIFQCNTVFFRKSLSQNSKIISIMWFGVAILLCILSFLAPLEERKKKVIKFEIIGFLVLSIALFISYVVYPFSLISGIIFFIPLLIVPVFLNDLINNDGKSSILTIFKNIVTFLAVISLMFWIISLMGFIPKTSISIDWGNTKKVYGYFHLHFLAQSNVSFLGIPNIVRNTGIFVEAPMYSYVLNLALFVSVFIDDEYDKLSGKSWILILTIISTTSSTGTIILVLTVFIKFALLAKKISYSLKSVMVIIIIPLVYGVIEFIVSKKVDDKWYSSTGIRMNDFSAAYVAWKNNFILGNGIDNYNSIAMNMDQRRFLMGNSGFSSGLMEALAYGGILHMLYYLLPVAVVINRNKRVLAIAVLTLILFIFTLVNKVYLYYIFISYFWAVFLKKDRLMR